MPTPTVSRTAVLVGLAALIPVPFIDELVRRFLLKMCFEEQATLMGRPLPDGTAWKLSKQRSNILIGCLLAVFWWPIKKLFRTMLFFLLVKDAIDWATDAAVRSAMVRRALERGALPGDTEAVWKAIDDAADEHVKSPALRVVLDPKAPPAPWTATDPGIGKLLAWLAQWGRGHAALQAFDAALDDLGADRIGSLPPPAAEE
jgi:hypothetical protein